MNQGSTLSSPEMPEELLNPLDAKEAILFKALKNNEVVSICQKENFTCRVKNFFRFLFNLGVTPQVPFREAKLIRFTNVLTLLAVMGTLLYIPFSIVTQSYLLAIFEMCAALFISSALWFSQKRKYSISKFIFIGGVNLIIYIKACYVGYEANIQHFYVLINIAPFLIFRMNQYRYIVASFAMTIGFFILYQFTYDSFKPYNLPLHVQRGIYSIGVWLDFIFFAIGIYILAKNNFEIEEELAASYVQLQSKSHELKRSNEDLEQFAYIISHDLRVPLRNIINFLNILDRKHGIHLHSEAKELIHFSVSGAKRMEQLIEDMLAYSKLGRNLPPPHPVDVNDIVKTIEFELRDKILSEGQKIVVAKKMPFVHGVHTSMIYHVFQNLITNGLKFNKSVHPQVTIDVQERDSNYVFSVADNGIGIPEEYKSKLFQMFKRLHTDSEFQGTGIGLAICKKIINFYNGEIWFESQRGKGTTFYFSIPQKQKNDDLYFLKL